MLALHAPTGAIVCPYELCMAAMGNAIDNGATLIREFSVSSIKKSADGYVITSDKGESVEAKVVVNAAGVNSDLIAKMAGDDSFSVHARRGE